MIVGSSLREFAKDSRILEAMRNTLSSVSSIFFPRRTVSQNPTGIRKANAVVNERNLNP